LDGLYPYFEKERTIWANFKTGCMSCILWLDLLSIVEKNTLDLSLYSVKTSAQMISRSGSLTGL